MRGHILSMKYLTWLFYVSIEALDPLPDCLHIVGARRSWHSCGPPRDRAARCDRYLPRPYQVIVAIFSFLVVKPLNTT